MRHTELNDTAEHHQNLPQHHLQVVAHTDYDLDNLKLWKLQSLEGFTPWFIPRGDYVEAKLSVNSSSLISVELFTRSKVKVTAHLRVDHQVFTAFEYIVGTQQNIQSNDVGSITSSLSTPPPSLRHAGIEPQMLWRSILSRRSLSLIPDQLSCQSNQISQEVLDVLALTLKDTQHGLERAWILTPQNQLTEYNSAQQTYRHIERNVQIDQRPHQWIWTWDNSGSLDPNSTPDTPGLWVRRLVKDLDLITLNPHQFTQQNSQPILVNANLSLAEQLPKEGDE